ncbi:MAG TPA: hypothetical protein VIL74_08770 [Pyrinomonadaceae bacterium]|jgi:hypothetical protein
MIRFENENFIAAVENHPEPKSKIALKADSNIRTLKKVLSGDDRVEVGSVARLANYVGLELVVAFVPKTEAVTAAN